MDVTPVLVISEADIKSIITPCGWDTMSLYITQGVIFKAFPRNSLVPIYTPGWVERGIMKVKCSPPPIHTPEWGEAL